MSGRDPISQLAAHAPEGQRTVDAIPAQVWIAAPDGAITYVNRQRLDYTGSTADEALGWGWATGGVFHPEDLSRLVDGWRLMLAAGQPGEVEARVRRFDCAYRWFLIRAVPSRDANGTVVEWFATNTDIHERKLAEQQLRQSEHEYRQIVDAIPLLITALGPRGTLLYVNRSVLDYSGLAADEVADGARLFHPDDFPRLMEERQRGMRDNVAFEQEARVRRHDGAYRWFLIQNRPVLNDRATSIGGTRAAPISTTAGATNSGCATKISSCVRRSIAPRCSRKLLDRHRR